MATLQENIRQANSDFNAIKAKIVEKGVEIAEGTKTEEYAVKVGKVYEKGRQDYQDKFWGVMTNYGKGNTDMRSSFGGEGWTDENFTPLYDFKPIYAKNMFFASHIKNLAKCFEDYGTKLDVSLITSTSDMFSFSTITRIPYLDFSNVTSLGYAFDNATSLEIIDGIKITEKCTAFGNAFRGVKNLRRMIVSGTIGASGLDLHWSVLLDKESINSIINALSTTTSGLTVILSKTAVNTAFATSEGASDGSTSEEWNALMATKTNWTISLS